MVLKTHNGFARTFLSVLMGVYFLYFISVMSSCKQKTPDENSKAPIDTGIHKSYERGPLHCTVDIDKAEMTIADRLNLKISAIIDENYEVELPAIGDKLTQFSIVDYHTSAPELIDGHKKKISRSYVLEPFLSGDYSIPTMTVRFWKIGEQTTDDHHLETEEIKISIKSLLPENFKDMKLNDIRPPVTLPLAISAWIWVIGISGLAVIGGAFFWIVRKRRNQRQTLMERRLSPHDQALLELERLIAQNLIEKGEIKIFYYEITHILRRYIENRFGIKAPEQTTEEFLEGLKSNTTFPKNYKDILKNFLMRCDLVKFAAHQPATDDIQQTFNSCRNFISETKIAEMEE